MTTQEKVIEIFANLGVSADTEIRYKGPDGKKAKTNVESFGYIIEQADAHGVIYIPFLETYENGEEIVRFAGCLLEMINEAIVDGTFVPITAESLDLYDAEDWEDLEEE